MSTLTILRGLPGAGKSTLAATLVDADTVRVNKDLLREMLHCKEYGIRNELLVRDVEYVLTRYLLRSGKNVILDGTHLGSLEKWELLANDLRVKLETREVTTDWQKCIEQDKERGKAGGRRVGRLGIGAMAVLKSIIF